MDLNKLTIRPLKQEYQSEIGYRLAVEKTKDNGIDEIFFEQQGKKYVAFNQDAVAISTKDFNAAAFAEFNNKKIKLLHTNNEVNSNYEKIAHTGKDAFFSAAMDGIGGAVAGALVAKIGLSSNMVKLAAAAGFVTSFAKEAVSVTLTNMSEYKNPDWNSLAEYTDKLPSSHPQKNAMIINTTSGPIKVGVSTAYL